VVSRDVRLHAEQSQYLFLGGKSSDVLAQVVEGQGVIISEVLAERLGMRVGDHNSHFTGSIINQALYSVFARLDKNALLYHINTHRYSGFNH